MIGLTNPFILYSFAYPHLEAEIVHSARNYTEAVESGAVCVGKVGWRLLHGCSTPKTVRLRHTLFGMQPGEGSQP